MKKLAGLVVILAVLVLGGYYGMGVMTERTVKNTVDVVNQVNGMYAEVVEYHRGWFSSDALISMKLHVPERVSKNEAGQSVTLPAENYQGQMPVVIYHGPFIFSPSGLKFGLGYLENDFNLPAKYAQQFDTMFTPDSDKPKLQINLFVNYLNKTVVGMGIPAFKLVAKQGGGQFEWLGMHSSTTVASNLNTVVGSLIIDGMKVSKDKTQIDMGEFDTQYDLYKAPNGLMLGEASVQFPEVMVKQDQNTLFSMNGLEMSSDAGVDGDLFNAHMSASLGLIETNGQKFGPGQFEMAVRNLDAEVLAKINQQAKAVQNGTEQEKQQALIALLPEIPKLFSKGAELEVSQLSMTLPQGDINGNMMIALPAGDVSNPFELLQKVKGHGSLKMPIAVVKEMMTQSIRQQMAKQPDMQQALMQQMHSGDANQSVNVDQLVAMQVDQRLKAIVQSGLVSQQDADYVIEFDLNAGQFTVNGQAFNPGMLKF